MIAFSLKVRKLPRSFSNKKLTIFVHFQSFFNVLKYIKNI
jgi:hypothetical protein